MNVKNLNPTLSQWTERVNPVLAYQAVPMAHQAICLHELACYVKTQKLEPYLNRRVKEEWPELAKSHRSVMQPLLEFLTEQPAPEASDIAYNLETYLQAKYGMRPDGEVRQYIAEYFGHCESREEFVQLWNEVSKKSVQDISQRTKQYIDRMQDVEFTPIGDPVDFLQKPFAAFYLRVFVPCLLETGLPYGSIHICARRGNPHAIECVLRNNPAALRDPRIMEHYDRAKAENRPLFCSLQKAINDEPIRLEVTPLKAKAFTGVMIYQSCLNFEAGINKVNNIWRPAGLALKPFGKFAISVMDIFCLFNAIARHVSRGKDLFDRDIPSDNTFKQAVNRMRQSFQQIRARFGLCPGKFYTLQ